MYKELAAPLVSTIAWPHSPRAIARSKDASAGQLYASHNSSVQELIVYQITY